jgi:hypothetical protein
MKKLLLFFLCPLMVLAAEVPPKPATILPAAPTEVLTKKEQKLTAGDVVVLRVDPPIEDGVGAEPSMSEDLKKGPVELGTGRILWWKAAPEQKDKKSGAILFGVTNYTPGIFNIPSVTFNKNGQGVFTSQTEVLEYSAVGGDKSKDDVYPPEAVGFPKWVVLLLSFLALVAALGGIFAIHHWYQKRRKKIEELARAPRILDPVEEFEQARAATERKGYLEKENYKPHYFALSDAAKKFLARAYRFDAEERTTRELVRELEGFGLQDKLLDQWEKVFEEMDVTKFTDQLPEKDVAKSLSERLSSIVGASYANSPVGREAFELRQQQARQPK